MHFANAIKQIIRYLYDICLPLKQLKKDYKLTRAHHLIRNSYFHLSTPDLFLIEQIIRYLQGIYLNRKPLKKRGKARRASLNEKPFLQ